MPEITVKAIKSFNADGLKTDVSYVKRGSEFSVDESVARDLLRSGLIEDYGVKNAEKPENKKAPEPANKSASKPSTKQADK
jgi:hypothetical protein